MSIYDNIAYGPRTHGIRNKAKLDEIVERSLRGAAIWDEVKDRLKKSALGLSGGQQQRICIARALAVEPDILLMDEATSALDNVAEYHVQKAVNRLVKARTTFIVAHRLSTIRNADRIVVMENGIAVEIGSYEELMQRGGRFCELERLSRIREESISDG